MKEEIEREREREVEVRSILTCALVLIPVHTTD